MANSSINKYPLVLSEITFSSIQLVCLFLPIVPDTCHWKMLYKQCLNEMEQHHVWHTCRLLPAVAYSREAVDGCHVNCQDILSYQAVMPSMRNHQCISCYAHPHNKSRVGVVTEQFPVDWLLCMYTDCGNFTMLSQVNPTLSVNKMRGRRRNITDTLQ
jgi:hypothetical protein